MAGNMEDTEYGIDIGFHLTTPNAIQIMAIAHLSEDGPDSIFLRGYAHPERTGPLNEKVKQVYKDRRIIIRPSTEYPDQDDAIWWGVKDSADHIMKTFDLYYTKDLEIVDGSAVRINLENPGKNLETRKRLFPHAIAPPQLYVVGPLYWGNEPMEDLDKRLEIMVRDNIETLRVYR